MNPTGTTTNSDPAPSNSGTTTNSDPAPANSGTTMNPTGTTTNSDPAPANRGSTMDDSENVPSTTTTNSDPAPANSETTTNSDPAPAYSGTNTDPAPTSSTLTMDDSENAPSENPMDLICTVCNLEFVCHRSLELHCKSERHEAAFHGQTPDGRAKFVCFLCWEAYDYLDNFQMHCLGESHVDRLWKYGVKGFHGDVRHSPRPKEDLEAVVTKSMGKSGPKKVDKKCPPQEAKAVQKKIFETKKERNKRKRKESKKRQKQYFFAQLEKQEKETGLKESFLDDEFCYEVRVNWNELLILDEDGRCDVDEHPNGRILHPLELERYTLNNPDLKAKLDKRLEDGPIRKKWLQRNMHAYQRKMRNGANWRGKRGKKVEEGVKEDAGTEGLEEKILDGSLVGGEEELVQMNEAQSDEVNAAPEKDPSRPGSPSGSTGSPSGSVPVTQSDHAEPDSLSEVVAMSKQNEPDSTSGPTEVIEQVKPDSTSGSVKPESGVDAVKTEAAKAKSGSGRVRKKGPKPKAKQVNKNDKNKVPSWLIKKWRQEGACFGCGSQVHRIAECPFVPEFFENKKKKEKDNIYRVF